MEIRPFSVSPIVIALFINKKHITKTILNTFLFVFSIFFSSAAKVKVLSNDRFLMNCRPIFQRHVGFARVGRKGR
jgi:hypothetical protein